MQTYFARTESPVGELLLVADMTRLRRISMPGQKHATSIEPGWVHDANHAPLAQAIEQLEEYFAGQRKTFDLPLSLEGTEFQQRVWSELTHIPFGETLSYGDIARKIGNPKAVRAVGLANGKNPIAIVVPCHRVIGANGMLTGYGGGLRRKEFLLKLEGSLI